MARGRRRDLKKQAFWRRMLRGQAGSGLPGRAWCGKHAVWEFAFYWWRTRLTQRDVAAIRGRRWLRGRFHSLAEPNQVGSARRREPSQSG